jgi:hypothetical protein
MPLKEHWISRGQILAKISNQAKPSQAKPSQAKMIPDRGRKTSSIMATIWMSSAAR